MHVFICCLLYIGFLPVIVFGQRFQLRLDGAFDGTFVNNIRFLKHPSEQIIRSPWRHVRTLFVDRVGLTSTLTVDYDQLTETINLGNALLHLFEADDAYDYGLTAHLFTSASVGAVSDPSNLDLHVLLHAASDVPAFLSANATEICITVAFKSETLQSNSVCSLSWPYDTVCIVGRSLDRRWFIGNKSVNVSFSIRPVSSSSYCTINYQDPLETTRLWHQVGKVAAPSLTGSASFQSKLLDNHHRVELASSEVGNGRPQVSLLLPPRDSFFRAGDLLRLPVHLNPGNSLASLLIRVNASPSLQLSEMRLLHSDWRLSIISDSNNRVAVIRATADPTSNISAIVGGPLLEYDFRVVMSPSSKNDQPLNSGTNKPSTDQRSRSWASLDSFVDDVVVGSSIDGTTSSTLSSAGLSWEVEMVSRDSASVGLAAVDAVFRLDNDPVIAIIPVVKVSRVFNYAVLRDSIQRMPIWLYGFTAQSGLIQLWDGECSSSDNEVIKVESMCRYLYLDGSETRGSENVTINITRRRLTVTVRLSVLFPELPLKLDISDVNLQMIRNFLVPAPSIKNKPIQQSNNSNNRCRSHYQRAAIRIFARFSYPSNGSPFAIDAEVTEWLRSIIRVVNTSVADYDGHSLVGMAPGQTLVQLITAAGQLIASRPVTVTSSHPVSITRLDALIADRIDIAVSPSQSMHSRSFVADNNNDKAAKFNFFDITASLRRVSFVHHQRRSNTDDQPTTAPGRLFVIAHFSDGTFLDLATLPSNWYELSVQPAANSDAAVPRVALFEVAKCRRQSVDEHLYSASTSEQSVTVATPLSVIRIDGSELMMPSDAETLLATGTEQALLSQGDSPSTQQRASDATTIAVGILLGILLVFLIVLVIVAFRRRIKIVVRDHIDPDHPLVIQMTIFYKWLKNTRFSEYVFENLVQKPRKFIRRFRKGGGVVNVSTNVTNLPHGSFDEDVQSCGGDEYDDKCVCEPASHLDRNWVWLSRETLEKHSIDTMRSHPLLPDATFRSLCCSAGGVGTGARSPAISTTGSNASRSGRLSTAPLLKGGNSEDNADTAARLAGSSSSPTDELMDSEESPISNGQRTTRTASPCINVSGNNNNSNTGFTTTTRNWAPTVYTGSECSLRILPCQPSRHGSTAALQLVAPDGRLMATAFASRTLDHHRRRARGYQNQMHQAFLMANSTNTIETHHHDHHQPSSSEQQTERVDEPPSVLTMNADGHLLPPPRKNDSHTSLSMPRDQIRFSSLRKPSSSSSRKNSLNRTIVDVNNNTSVINYSGSGSSTPRENYFT